MPRIPARHKSSGLWARRRRASPATPLTWASRARFTAIVALSRLARPDAHRTLPRRPCLAAHFDRREQHGGGGRGRPARRGTARHGHSPTVLCGKADLEASSGGGDRAEGRGWDGRRRIFTRDAASDDLAAWDWRFRGFGGGARSASVRGPYKGGGCSLQAPTLPSPFPASAAPSRRAARRTHAHA